MTCQVPDCTSESVLAVVCVGGILLHVCLACFQVMLTRGLWMAVHGEPVERL